MKISQTGLDLIKKWEGYREKAYQDIVGVWTVGYGSTRIYGRKVLPSDSLTESTAVAFLEKELEEVGAYKVLNKLNLNQNQFDALCSFIYNLGITNFNKSTLKKKLVAGDYVGASYEFIRWNKAGGKGVAGLTKRRIAESKLFTKKL